MPGRASLWLLVSAGITLRVFWGPLPKPRGGMGVTKPPKSSWLPQPASPGMGPWGPGWGPSPNASSQCHPALDGQRGKCWCVDRKTGVKLPGFLELKGDLDCHQLADSM